MQPVSPPPPVFAHAVPPPATTDARARTAAWALLGSALLMFAALLSKSWFTAGSSGYVGPLGVDRCHGLICRSTMWFDVKHIPPQIPIFATCALLGTIAAIGFLIHAAAVLLQGAPHKVKLRWVAQTIGLATLGCACFVFSLSVGDWSRGLSIGWASFVGLGATLGAGAITATLVRPLSR